jgi:hypothetical protein
MYAFKCHNNFFALCQNAPTAYTKRQWALKALQLLAAELPGRVLRRATYRLQDMLLECRFNGVSCTR